MKKNILFSLIIGASLLLCSCEEDSFSPKTDFVQRHILTCIIDCDSDIQTATLSTSYSIEGYDPYSNTMDPSFQGAEIRIWYRDTVFVMRDTVVPRDDTSRYDEPYKYYYAAGLKPERGEVLNIEATLPDGKKITSTTSTVSLANFYFGDGDQMMPAANGPLLLPTFNVYWTFIGEADQNLFVPRLFLMYDKIENGVRVPYSKEIPSEYSQSGDLFTPSYPIGQKSTLAQYQTSAIDRLMAEISEGDPVKENYIISRAVIQLLVLDRNLSAFYGSLQMKSDGFSVRVDAPEFTNIENGLGVFGSFNEYTWDIEIMEDYIQSFGYQIDF